MSDTKRIILAGSLITFLLLLLPYYLNLIGYVDYGDSEPESSKKKNSSLHPSVDFDSNVGLDSKNFKSNNSDVMASNEPSKKQEALFTITTSKYLAKASNSGGGSLTSYSIIENLPQYKGGYDFSGEYNDSSNVELILNNGALCAPCVEIKTPTSSFILNDPFEIKKPSYGQNAWFLNEKDSLVLEFQFSNNQFSLIKLVTFYGNSFVVNHDIKIIDSLDPGLVVGLVWDKGLRPSEKNIVDDVSYAHASLAKEKNIESLSFSPSSELEKKEGLFIQEADWAAIRTKYFLMAMLPTQKEPVSASILGRAYKLQENVFVPSFVASLHKKAPQLNCDIYLGPLDLDQIQELSPYLDRIMNFGWFLLQPFSRSVLWLLKFLHSFGLNYGVILVLFAVFVRVVTGPLTKKSHQSAQKMQEIQPKLKKIQKKYKNNPQKLNQETINLYKESGTNPLGGCLPMLLQMPLLFALFIVFRSTIEFRGAPFFGWISNLSQPDTIVYLPWNIPIYGDQIAFLPILLGITMFLSQSISAATMDSKQKPLMYIMTGFFFLIFNSFPSGLNLYYVVYNLLNYLQQKSLKKA